MNSRTKRVWQLWFEAIVKIIIGIAVVGVAAGIIMLMNPAVFILILFLILLWMYCHDKAIDEERRGASRENR
jgi:hypothetical protein